MPVKQSKKPIRETQQASEKKWGKAVMKVGFNIFPSLILKAQTRLGLNPTQLALLLHLTDFWWDVNRLPWPSVKTLSERTGLSTRQVQRHLSELETCGLITRIERRAKHKGKMSNEFSFAGLVEKLNEFAPEFLAAEEEAKEARSKVTKRRSSLKLIKK
jgi:DNA-binding transcriptional ArsR family regulator